MRILAQHRRLEGYIASSIPFAGVPGDGSLLFVGFIDSSGAGDGDGYGYGGPTGDAYALRKTDYGAGHGNGFWDGYGHAPEPNGDGAGEGMTGVNGDCFKLPGNE